MTSSQPAAAGVDINPLHAPCFGEVLIDSRIVAQNLDSGQHRSLFRLTKRHEVRLRRIRIPRFEVAEIKGRGQPERYTLLNEDQTDLLIFLSFNPPPKRVM